jgi:hypothetical protein
MEGKGAFNQLTRHLTSVFWHVCMHANIHTERRISMQVTTARWIDDREKQGRREGEESTKDITRPEPVQNSESERKRPVSEPLEDQQRAGSFEIPSTAFPPVRAHRELRTQSAVSPALPDKKRAKGSKNTLTHTLTCLFSESLNHSRGHIDLRTSLTEGILDVSTCIAKGKNAQV